jgi:hypothetical protein
LGLCATVTEKSACGVLAFFGGRLQPKAWNTGEEYRGAEHAALLMCKRGKKSAKNFNQNKDLWHFRKLHSVAQKFFKK